MTFNSFIDIYFLENDVFIIISELEIKKNKNLATLQLTSLNI